MRVQGYATTDGTLVEYYDSAYNLLDTKIIPKELSLFGGFYATDSNYFLLTGQTNEDESADVEVYRITKYDKQWNRLGSAGLYDCNTTVPFDAGSARMDASGQYLLIRTCHKMYQSKDGYNHQANVTIQLDMESMEITDSYTTVMNTDYGYVSHSFNQFIKVENNHIIAVDHGDANPRAIALLKYSTDISTGKFVPGYYTPCTVKNVLDIPGNKGENKTGASVGGFEISDSAYLVAGNSVVQDADNLSRSTRNIFVSAVNKDLNAVNTTWLTNYSEGDGTTSTPHLVKINADQYMILWSRNSTVYYAMINGSGKKTGETYTISGNLSDCVPTVNNGKLTWYTWNNSNITFYEISLSDLSQATKKVIINGHDFENEGTTDGVAKMKCKICGITQSVTLMTSMRIYWNDTNGIGTYSTILDSDRNVGDNLYYWIRDYAPTNADTQMEITISNPEVVSITPSSDTEGKITALKTGKTMVTFQSKYNPSLKKTYTIYVNGDLALDSFTANPETQARKGKTITLSADAVGGTWSYTYKFYVQDETGKVTTIQDYSSSASCTWVPESIGEKTLYVDVKDSDGTTTTKSMDYEIIDNDLSEKAFQFTTPENLIYDGQKKSASITGIAEGLGDITLNYYDSKGNKLSDAPVNAGTYTVKIDMAEGTVYGKETDLT